MGVSAMNTIANQSDANAVITAKHVYEAINAVQKDIVSTGISKDKRTTGSAQYNFRGIDDVYNALSPLMAKHKLIISPRFQDRRTEERITSKGYSLFYTTVTGYFDFISAIDGSTHTVVTFGEAMDSGDKGTNKAMSIAYKYACFQLFAIPTEASEDPDAYVHPQDRYQSPNQNESPALLLPAPTQAAAFNLDGKLYDQYKRRIFNAEQFKAVLKSIEDGSYPITKFTDSNKYFYSEAQVKELQKFMPA